LLQRQWRRRRRLTGNIAG